MGALNMAHFESIVPESVRKVPSETDISSYVTSDDDYDREDGHPLTTPRAVSTFDAFFPPINQQQMIANMQKSTSLPTKNVTRSNPFYIDEEPLKPVVRPVLTKRNIYASRTSESDDDDKPDDNSSKEFEQKQLKPTSSLEKPLSSIQRKIRRRSPPPDTGVSRSIANTVKQFENTEDVPIKKYDLTTNEPISLLYPH